MSSGSPFIRPIGDIASDGTVLVVATDFRRGVFVLLADDRYLLVYDRDTLPARIFALDYRTGQRRLWREFAPADSAGITGFGTVVISNDGRIVAYNYSRSLSTAYLLSGLE